MRKIARVVILSAAAIGGGVLLAVAYAPWNVWVLAPISIALLVYLQWFQRLRLAAWLGFLFGVTTFVVQHMWLGVVGSDAQWLLSAYLGLWISLVGLGTSWVSRHLKSIPAIMLVTGLWVTEEALRGRYPFGGYPWARIVFSQADSPFVHWSTLAGAPFVTAVVVLVGVSLAVAIKTRRYPIALLTAGVVAVTALVPVVYSAPTTSRQTFTIAVIQGGTPQTGLGAMDVRRAVLDNHVRETELLAQLVATGKEPQPDLVLWPENSSDINPYTDDSAYLSISSAARAINAPILVGAVVDSFEDPETEVYNMGILWDPVSGPGETYIKNAPVPFGEFIPFRSLLTQFISRYDRVPRDFAHGVEPGIFELDGVRLGDLICFEVAVDPVVDRIVDEGASVILVQTNNATYAKSALPEQQLNIERIRAIETGRAVVVAATTGISATILPQGEVVNTLVDGETGSFVSTVPVLDQRTVGTVLGAWIEIAIVWGTLITLGGVLLYRRIVASR